ncbi:MAG TPA: MG2 domain-containing protein [Bacteroidia bacterium]|nr:MG2 domain-containing protein [Bacteroidia bacterium]
MNWTKIKWMLLGAGISILSVFIFNNLNRIKEIKFDSSNKFEFQKINPEFAQYISAFTTGYISSGSSIKIKFTSQILENIALNTAISEDLFEFDDEIKGAAFWIDAQTIEFRPTNRLEAGKKYSCKFHLNKLIDVKNELKVFEFSFKVVNQSLKVEFNNLKTYDASDFTFYKSSGIIYTADYIESTSLEKVISAQIGNKNAQLSWTHDQKGTTHRFYIDSIQRGSELKTSLIYAWNGKEIKVETSGHREFKIPAKNNFELLNVEVVSSPEQFIQLIFSNPLNNAQSLEGLISLGDLKNLKFIVENNEVRIYPNEIKTGTYKLKIAENVRDGKDNMLGSESVHQIKFEESKPKINFSGKGVILPSSNGMSIPFEAVNLKAVDITVVKLYENNVLQFLQTNDLDGEYQMARVGKTILEKTISLGITNPADFKTKKKFSLDLSSLIKAEQGAIYRISLSFKKSYSTFPCGGVSNTDNLETEELKEKRIINSNYQYYYEYSDYYYDDDYNWNERENPCNSSYYSSYNTSVSKNIIASDIGLTVKKGTDDKLFIAASDLITTEPISNLDIEFYDYQQQLIEKVKTNADGQLFITPKEMPYFIVAKKDQQRAYIKMDDGNTLSLTMFDTEGNFIERGLKGFIYGERGVWRPGDTLFLGFILEDKMNMLPKNHPMLFELHNPQGIIYKKILKAKGVDGFYTFPVTTDINVPTGNWTAICKVGAAVFTKNIRVETVMPNRLKISINIGNNKVISAKGNEQFKLHANWLTGANARNLKATAELALSAQKTTFDKFKNYIFDDITQKFESEKINVFDGKLNDQGDINFPFKVNTKSNASGILRANLITRVYESGGAFSVDRFKFNYSPFETYVGISLPETEKNTQILYTNKTQEIKIATVNQNGEAVNCNKLLVSVYKLSWRWWWDQYEDEFANYVASDYHKPIYTEEISSHNGKSKFNLNIKEEDWGRYLIRVQDIEGGHSCAVTTYFDYPNWMERNGSENKIVASLLHFTTNKENYTCNEEVTVNIPSPKGGRALVTIETGSKIIDAKWVETTSNSTKFKFKVTPEMAPNIYVHVSLIQAHAQSQNDLPIRLYGVLPIKIDDPQTHLRPLIKMPDVLAPEAKANISISEENGKEMTYTIAMVDEGLLDLTRFSTPDPWSHFYAREALGIKTWDIYDYVIGAYGGELERILSIGGDGTEINRDAAKANRFKPLVKFLGPFHLKKGEKVNHSINMPMYIGSVRTMVIAGYKGAYGNAEKTCAVKSSIMLLGTLPRVLSVNEEVTLPVSIFGGDVSLNNVNVEVSTNHLIDIIGEHSQITKLKNNEEQLLNFKLKVKSLTGIAQVKITATSGTKKTHYSMELDIRNPNPYRTDVKSYFVEAGQTLSQQYQAIGTIGNNTGVIEISSIPPLNLEDRLDYLISYPHGCVEQTTSAAFAQLYIDEITNLSSTRKNEIESNIKIAIDKLQKFQLEDGSFSYWPGLANTNDWSSIYVGHFLFSAEKKGYQIPITMKQNWLRNQQKLSDNWINTKTISQFGDYVQAYRLFVLAFAGKPSLSAMNRLKEQGNLSMQAKWSLAAAYTLTNNSDAATKIIYNLPSEVKPYKIDYFTFGSESRDEAMILQTLCLLDKKTQAFHMLKKVSSQLSGKGYLNTQTTAFSILGVRSFINKYGSVSALQAQVSINDRPVILTGNNPINTVKLDYSKNKNGTFKVVNHGKGIIYIKLINKGKPFVGEEREEEDNVLSSVVFKTDGGTILDPTKIKQGTNFIMEVTVKNTGIIGNLKNVALLNYIPSGWEIHNSRMDENEASLRNSSYDYQDIRDDKIMTYFDLMGNETKTFKFKLNASYLGSYYMPGINVEAMYDNSAYSRKKGSWIKVVK